jgi:hypothetical protein
MPGQVANNHAANGCFSGTAFTGYGDGGSHKKTPQFERILKISDY